ncbi:hypothetical protein [Castellaniella ginsengisoli]|uniref:Uncharacterized protein n=1 Tax=Castellaniella ginsengisoli TaxID=546114 RepID=A0AB39DA68_9BURK
MPHHGAIAHKKPPRIRKAAGAFLVLAAALLQSSSPAWAVDRLSTGQSWYVLNETGIDTLGVQRLRITGPDADAFTIEGYTGSPTGMTPSQDVLTPTLVQKTSTTPLGVSLRFTPQHSGDHQANLEVTHNGSNSSPFTYSLTGSGAWDVTARASTDSMNFGERAVGMPAVTQDAFVRAEGLHGWLKVTGIKLEGSSDFTLAQAGLAHKGSSTWGTGANLEVLPAGATESTKAFTATDVSVGGLTDGAIRVRYTPTLRGPQTAVLTVYHDGPEGKTVMPVIAEGLRGTTVEVTQSRPYLATTPVTDFTRAGLGSATQTKTVYLKAGGEYGEVTYTGFEVVGSDDIRVRSVVQAYASNWNNGGYCNKDTIVNTISYSGEPDGGALSGTFSIKGSNVNGKCSLAPGQHLTLNLEYIPRTPGKQTATITVFHDGNDAGFTSFEISGEAFRDVSVEVTQNRPYLATAPVTGFARVARGSKTQLKTVYLKASGEYGEVTYTGFEVVGADDIRVRSVVQAYASNWNNGGYCNKDTVVNTINYSGEPDGGALSGTFSLKGSNVNGKCSLPPGQHLTLNLEYIPRTLGIQTATITVYHDGNAQGFTTFDISGEAY